MNKQGLVSELYLNGQKILQELDEQTPTIEDVHEYAKYLGIDLSNEEHLSWIAVQGLKSRLPDYFIPIEDSKGRIYFFNTQTSLSSWEHPADSECKKLLQQARKLNLSDSQATFAGESISTLEDFSLKSDDPSMSLQSERNFLKKVVPPLASLQQPRSVRFDIQSPPSPGDASSEEADPELDDMIQRFGFMDAASLSPVFIHSPEPEDVNSLLRLTNQSESLLRGSSAIGRSRPVSAAPPLSSSSDRKISFLKPLEPLLKKNGIVTPASVASATLEPLSTPRSIPKQQEKNLMTAAVSTSAGNDEIPNKMKNFEDQLKDMNLNKELEQMEPKFQQEIDYHTKELEMLADEWAKERIKMENDHKSEVEQQQLQLAKKFANEKVQAEERHQKELKTIEIEFNSQKVKLIQENNQNLERLQQEYDLQFSNLKRELVEKNKVLLEKTEFDLNMQLNKKKSELEANHKSKLDEYNLSFSQETEIEERIKKTLEAETVFKEQLSKQKIELENQSKEQLVLRTEQLALQFSNELKELETKQTKELELLQTKLSDELKSEQVKLEIQNKKKLVILKEELESQFSRDKKDLEEIQKINLAQAGKEINERLTKLKLQQECHFQDELENIKKEFTDQIAIKRVELQANYQESLDQLKTEQKNNSNLILTTDVLVSTSPTPSQQQQDRELLDMLGTLDKHLRSLDRKVELLHQKPSQPETSLLVENENNWEEDSSADETLNNNPPRKTQEDTGNQEEISHLKELLEKCQHRIVQIEGNTWKSSKEKQSRIHVDTSSSIPQDKRFLERRKITRKIKLKDLPLYHCDHHHCCTGTKKIGCQDGITKRAKKLLKHMDREEAELSRLECRHSLGQQIRNHRQYVDASSTSSSSTNNSISLNRHHLLPYQSLAMRMGVQSNKLHSGRSLSGSLLQGNSRLRHSWLHCFGEQTAPVIPASFASHEIPHDGSWENNLEMHSRDWWTQKIRNVREAVKECEDKRLSFNLNK